MKLGLLFPGYSNQFVGMAKGLYNESRLMQEYFEEASNCSNINFVKLCFASSDQELSKADNAYTALFLTSSAIAALVKQKGIEVSQVAGFGVGELSAIHTAGGITLPDGLYLLVKYAQLYQEALGAFQVNALHIKNIDRTLLKQLCSKVNMQESNVYIAAYLGEDDHIVTGASTAVHDLEDIALQHDAHITSAPIEIGLHNPMMDPVVVHLSKYLEKVDFKDTAIPVILSVDGKKLTDGVSIKRRFLNQLQSAIQWDKVIAQYADCDVIVQVGPGRKIAEALKKLYPDKIILTINKQEDIQLLESLTASSTHSDKD